MALRVCYYEDEKYTQFLPLTYVRPVYLLRAGIVPLFRRIERVLPDAEISLLAREQVAPLVADQLRDYPVNIIKREDGQDVLFLNGRIRDFGELVDQVTRARISTVFTHGDEIVAVLLRSDVLGRISRMATPEMYLERYASEKKDIPDLATTATLYNFCWDIMADIEREISADFRMIKAEFDQEGERTVHDGAFIVNKAAVRLGDGVEILPGAVIDASKGPVIIGQNTRVDPHAAIFGPCFVGPNTVVAAGKIAASSIGHTCRVGGEVEETVFQSYVNKWHAGFVGHSYVGSWVNFGAMTTNSDLKNNYSTIRLTVNGKAVDSGAIKVGSFIGDHTKFGIGTLLNTGISIGVCCNIFGGSLVADKEVPSFSWGATGQYEPYQIEKALETAERTTGRRNVLLTDHEKSVLRAVFEKQESSAGIITW